MKQKKSLPKDDELKSLLHKSEMDLFMAKAIRKELDSKKKNHSKPKKDAAQKQAKR